MPSGLMGRVKVISRTLVFSLVKKEEEEMFKCDVNRVELDDGHRVI